MKSNKIYPNQFFVSLIIVTYKRIFNVIDILEDLKSQSFREFEVIVVSDGCKTAFDKRIKAFSRFFPMQYLDTGLKNKYGLAAARNIGLRAVKSDYCILIDDDCRVSKDLIKNHYLNREKLTIVGGQRKGLGDEEIILSEKMKELRKLPYQKAFHIKKIKRNFPKISLIENNISFYKNDVLKVGLFFEYFCLYGIVGQEFFNRCKNYQFKYKYIHKAKITHLTNSKEVNTNKKKYKVMKSVLANIFIIPLIKNYFFVKIQKNLLSKIDYKNSFHKYIKFILWIIIFVFSPFLLLKKIFLKFSKFNINFV
jgi:glycosyltransferase involved in cell wall biosynthesis